MEVEELLAKAWAAVEKSGVPKEVREIAFKEAVSFLRGAGSVKAEERGVQDAPPLGEPAAKRSASPKRSAKRAAVASEARATLNVDEDEFFARLASESGAEETDLRDILNLLADGTVQVIPPTRKLGSSAAQQARTVIALVAGARAYGLGEKPVSDASVRAELQRKNCWQRSNYAASHLGTMLGFNAAGQGEILLNSKWVGEFVAAVNQAHGRKPDSD